ncbi:AGC protein kinase [Vittaforma corneae ATCC 50505]|uniref:AGC protein kinase n=1 Tax=Vittaforma corneae (strain ATCC 50505) TaxID=993615 RepID=L2GQV3_VITCO|nr:AGC protein kinase [Vittaforma corneae ATCC 50505]ELA42692.1 AGC protein kinase [Vittaforma corneae ATCC 50505]
MKKMLIIQNKTDEDMVMFELMIRSEIRHPFLINQVCAFQDYDNLYYITEYAPTLLLKSNILPKKFSCEITKFYAAEMFLCLKYLHSKGQNYTFLSSKNIFLSTGGHIKLGYSFCNCIECSNNGVLDDLEYLSPDYLENNRFGYMSDYWSLGIVIYQMIHGYTPFLCESMDLTMAEIKRCKLVIQEVVSEDTHSILHMLIDRNLMTKYPTCKALEDAIMKHSFFAEIDWVKLENKEYEPPFIIKLPEYDIKASPNLNLLYTSDCCGEGKDGYGNIFTSYNTVHFLKKK